MASAWPEMEVFELGKGGGWRGNTHVTLFGLVHIVNGWPKLISLTLDIDAESSYPDAAQIQLQGEPNYNMDVLDLGRSPIKRPEQVAAVLLHMFPNLQDVVTSWDENWLDGDSTLYPPSLGTRDWNTERSMHLKNWIIVNDIIAADCITQGRAARSKDSAS